MFGVRPGHGNAFGRRCSVRLVLLVAGESREFVAHFYHAVSSYAVRIPAQACLRRELLTRWARRRSLLLRCRPRGRPCIFLLLLGLIEYGRIPKPGLRQLFPINKKFSQTFEQHWSSRSTKVEDQAPAARTILSPKYCVPSTVSTPTQVVPSDANKGFLNDPALGLGSAKFVCINMTSIIPSKPEVYAALLELFANRIDGFRRSQPASVMAVYGFPTLSQRYCQHFGGKVSL